MTHDLIGLCSHTHYDGGPHCVHTAYQQGREDMLAKASDPKWLRQVIVANIFDGEDSGVLTAKCALIADDVAEVISTALRALQEKP